MTLSLEELTNRRRTLAFGLVSADVAYCVTHPAFDHPSVHPDEAAGLSPRAVEKRRREFAAGRFAARSAAQSLGLDRTFSVPIGPNRAPVWPDGITGSITHTKTCAAAIVARTGSVQALGLDAEEATPLEEKLWDEILSLNEQHWANEQADPGLMAKLVFSAKEAAYKAQFSLSSTYFGFAGMETRWDMQHHSFTATFTRDAAPFNVGDTVSGRFAIGEGVILTAVELRT